MNNEQLLDIETLRSALAVNMLCGDRGDLKGYLSGFTDDGELTIHGETHEGRDGIKGFLVNRGKEFAKDPDTVASRRNLKHQITTMQINFIEEDQAELYYYLIITAGGGILSLGHCEDTMSKIGGDWLISKRSVHFDE